jgi:hypothetical protein
MDGKTSSGMDASAGAAESLFLRIPMKRLYKPCGICFGRGVMRKGARYVKCSCGRLVDSRGAKLLGKQKKLDERYQELKDKGW